MPDVNEQIVKDFFETHGFVVSTNVAFQVTTNGVRQYSDFDLVVRNVSTKLYRDELPFELDRKTVKGIDAAVIEVKGWHSESLVPSYLKENSESRKSILGFVEKSARNAARKASGVSAPKYVLAVSELARTKPARAKTIKLLQDAGVDHVILFAEILAALTEEVDVNRHYAHSPTLHLLRLLKTYGTIEK